MRRIPRSFPFALAIAALGTSGSAAGPETPVSVVILIDTSGSMCSKLSVTIDIARTLIGGGGAEDEFAVIESGWDPVVIAKFGTPPAVTDRALVEMKCAGTMRTRLLDDIQFALVKSRAAWHSRKALVIISDGADNASKAKEKEIWEHAKHLGVPIYAIGITSPHTRGSTAEELEGPFLLSRLAGRTGGQYIGLMYDERLGKRAEEVIGRIRGKR